MRLKKFQKFRINEELEIKENVIELLNVLRNKKSKVAEFIMMMNDYKDLFQLPTDYISFGNDLNELSFLASNRIDRNDSDKNYEDTRRQSIRTGRLVRKMIADYPKNLNISYTGDFYIHNDEVILSTDTLHDNFDRIIDFLSDADGTITVKGSGVSRFKVKDKKGKKDRLFLRSYYYNNEPKKFKEKELKSSIDIDRTYTIGWYRTYIRNTEDQYGFLPKGIFVTLAITDETEVKNFDSEGEEIPTCMLNGTITMDAPINKVTNISDSDIEKFVNEFLAIRKELDFDSAGIEFKIVKGDDIIKYYSYKSYFGYGVDLKKGSLWQSCMRYDHCQKYFDLYTQNPDVVQLLILVTADDRLVGRALIWHLDGGEEEHDDGVEDLVDGIFLDRIYTINDSDERLFVNYAIKEGWTYRDKQAKICRDGVELEDDTLKVTLSNVSTEWYPYVDTLAHCNLQEDYLTNSALLHYDRDLSDTHGAWAGADNEEQDPEYSTDNG